MLVDDDIDDCEYFKEALDELHICYNLGIMHEGKNLINYLAANKSQLPDLLFLDINLPRKNGIECLSDLKDNKELAHIPVIIYSSSYPNKPALESNLIDMFVNMGAIGFVRKTNELADLKLEIHNAIILASETTNAVLN